ncbi:Cytochrome b-c1 complex subunit 7, mitochondrial [Elasticomyces elasticus]|nr:Cytochrome b-c1 complex subunit 7, mitochondrial [Elasticomyces elasticus]KAK4992435.1 Cytochrome b-c1 complex subunit 7, mitochondrial [Elasticomyces elasticus]KAK5002783.1 hypothetical protein LTR28_010985 [Elasticomyces elasticus]
MSQPSFANAIIKRPWLKRWMTPIANWYADAAGYRKLGLRADDLIPEESEVVLLALKRLSPKESYDRVFRMRRAFQCSLSHQLLPKNEQTKPEEDYQYLTPIIREIEAERNEREDLEAMVIKKPSRS